MAHRDALAAFEAELSERAQAEFASALQQAATLHSRATGVAEWKVRDAQRYGRRCPPGTCQWRAYSVHCGARRLQARVCEACLCFHTCLGPATCPTVCNAESQVVCSISGLVIDAVTESIFSDNERCGPRRAGKKRKADDEEERGGGDTMVPELDGSGNPDFDKWLSEALAQERRQAPRRTVSYAAASAASAAASRRLPSTSSSSAFRTTSVTPSPSASTLPPTPRDPQPPAVPPEHRARIEAAFRTHVPHIGVQMPSAATEAELVDHIAHFLWTLAQEGMPLHADIGHDVVAVLYLLAQGLINELSKVTIIPCIAELGSITKIMDLNRSQRSASRRKGARAGRASKPPAGGFALGVKTVKEMRKKIHGFVTARSRNPMYNSTQRIFPKLQTLTEVLKPAKPLSK